MIRPCGAARASASGLLIQSSFFTPPVLDATLRNRIAWSVVAWGRMLHACAGSCTRQQAKRLAPNKRSPMWLHLQAQHTIDKAQAWPAQAFTAAPKAMTSFHTISSAIAAWPQNAPRAGRAARCSRVASGQGANRLLCLYRKLDSKIYIFQSTRLRPLTALLQHAARVAACPNSQSSV